MHLTPTPTAESTRADTFGGPGARPLSSRAGAAGATACRRGLDGPHAAVRAPISLGNVANEGPGVRHRWRADDDACPSTTLTHHTKRCLDPTDRSRYSTRSPATQRLRRSGRHAPCRW